MEESNPSGMLPPGMLSRLLNTAAIPPIVIALLGWSGDSESGRALLPPTAPI